MAGALLAVLFIFSAFTAARPLQAEDSGDKIIIAGAPSLIPLVERFTAQYRKEHPAMEIEIRGGGSNYAARAVRLGQIDVGLVTRNLDPAEQAEFRTRSLGYDAIILLTYPGNLALGLTLEQLRGIYLGKITNWGQVGGEDKGVVALTRETGSALRMNFLERLFGPGFDGKEKAFTIRASKEKILRTIKRVEGALGYGIVRLEEAQLQGVKVLQVDGRLPTPETIHDGLYPFTRPRLLILKGTPKEAAQKWMAGFAKFANQAGDSKSGR